MRRKALDLNRLAVDLKPIGVDLVAELRKVANVPSLAESQAALVDLKRAVKLTYRKACLTLHPDKGGSESVFKSVSAAVEELQEVSVRNQPPPPPIQRHPAGWTIIEINLVEGTIHQTGGSSATTTGGTGSFSGHGGWWR